MIVYAVVLKGTAYKALCSYMQYHFLHISVYSLICRVLHIEAPLESTFPLVLHYTPMGNVPTRLSTNFSIDFLRGCGSSMSRRVFFLFFFFDLLPVGAYYVRQVGRSAGRLRTNPLMATSTHFFQSTASTALMMAPKGRNRSAAW